MQLEVKKYLDDILVSIDHILQFTSGVDTLENYSSNMIMKRAVERELEIIGEAIKRILDCMPDLKISNAKNIINTRNRIIHGYDDVDDAIIWAIILKHIPVLKSEAEILISEE